MATIILRNNKSSLLHLSRAISVKLHMLCSLKLFKKTHALEKNLHFFADIIKNNDAIKIYGPPKGLPLIGLGKFCFYF